jgi:hypothetical protein
MLKVLEEKIQKRWNGKHWCLASTQPIKRGEILFQLNGEILPQPDRYTLQIGEQEHIDCKLIRYVNHHCEPSGIFCNEDRTLRACRDLKLNEEITVNYFITEEHMDAPFDCDCESPHCMGRIQGFRHLDEAGRQFIDALAARLKNAVRPTQS